MWLRVDEEVSGSICAGVRVVVVINGDEGEEEVLRTESDLTGTSGAARP